MSGNNPYEPYKPPFYALYYFFFDENKNRWRCISSPPDSGEFYKSADDAERFAATGGDKELMLSEGPGTLRVDVREMYYNEEGGLDYVGTVAEYTFVCELSLRRFKSE